MATLNLGILAHVDAGKTTLTERLLFAAGVIDSVGRVDDGTTQTDSLDLERQRGITIKSAVASFVVDDTTINLIDTPGHPDFIAEVERVLGVLDGAVMVVSAVEGVQSQTLLLFRALRRLRVPTLFFVNKVDRAGADPDRVIAEIGERLDVLPVRMGTTPPIDLLAEHDEELLSAYLDGRQIGRARLDAALATQTAALDVHPVFAGAALSGTGVDALLAGITELLPTVDADLHGEPSGTVFKVERGDRGEKIALVRLFGGTLAVRDRIALDGSDETDAITAIDVFDRGGTEERQRTVAGEISRVKGLGSARVGSTFGAMNRGTPTAFAPPALETAIVASDPSDKQRVFAALVDLAEQDPLINLRQDDARGELFLSLYGEVQKEVVAQTLALDHGLPIEFRPTSPVCVERVLGTGHAVEHIRRGRSPEHPFLATVGLRVEPRPIGSGVEFELDVGVKSVPLHVFDRMEVFDELMRTTVLEVLQQGLQGWAVTDCLVTMTESDYQAPPRRWPGTTLSDYRDLTPLVLMAALREAGTVVCEPVLSFRLELPNDALGTMMALLASIDAHPTGPSTTRGSVSVLEGVIRAARVHDLQSRLPDLTRGEGVLESAFHGYEPVHGAPPTRPRTDRNPLDRTDYLRRMSGKERD